jgi:hypothetical protein
LPAPAQSSCSIALVEELVISHQFISSGDAENTYLAEDVQLMQKMKEHDVSSFERKTCKQLAHSSRKGALYMERDEGKTFR